MSASRRKPLVMMMLCCAGVVAPPAAHAAPDAKSAEVVVTRHDRLVLREMNRMRAAHGLTGLRIDARLQQAAHAHSSDMAGKGYFAHGDMAGRLARYGARGPVLAENLGWASGGDRARRVVSMWMSSPGHRANLLRPGFRRVGVGTVVGTIYGRSRVLLVTTDFAGT